MPIGDAFFTTIRNTLVSGFLALPVILITISAFLGTSTANVGFILVFLAQVFVIPFLQILLTYLRGNSFIQSILNLTPTMTYANFHKLCSISPVDVKPDMIPPPTSYWMANILFFTTYVITNGITLYNADTETKNVDATKVENRKAHALTSIILTSLVFAVFTYTYIVYVGCETPGSVLLASLVYIPLGYGWYKLAELCGLRTADTFGIASQLFIPSADNNSFPYACVNVATKTQIYNFGPYGKLTPEEFSKKIVPETTDKNTVDISYSRNEKGILTFTLTLNKQAIALSAAQASLLGGIAESFKKAFDTETLQRTTQTNTGAENRVIVIQAQPPAAYSI